ncbi:MAG: hypothetical protein WBA45_00925 [Microthrixaceae bacterium]
MSIVGRGHTPVVDAAGGMPRAKSLWSVTVESELGWYAMVSSACDIVRDPKIEPCIVVAPVAAVSHERYQRLRSGEYSPREFPLPKKEVARIVGSAQPDDFWPVVDLRYVTSVDKMALLSAEVESRRPLTGPQQKRFSTWVGRRFNRPMHSGQHEVHVLSRAGDKISKLARSFARAKEAKAAPPEVRLVGAAREWLIGGTDRHLQINVVVDAKSVQAVGMYNAKEAALDEPAIDSAARRLGNALAMTLPPDDGYVISVRAITLDGIPASEYLALEPWLWADLLDPLVADN